MVIYEWNPFEEMQRMQNEMNRLFQHLGTDNQLMLENKNVKNPAQLQGFRMPVTDMYETEKSIVAQFELPGVDKKDIHLEVSEDGVSVKVEKKTEAEQKHKGYYKYESISHAFYRKLPLPEGIDVNKADASYKDGILKVEIPRSEKALQKAKRLEIK